jgi:hypothetical protein
LGEVLPNGAEAAFELGQTSTAAAYMNAVRARAGLVVSLTWMANGSSKKCSPHRLPDIINSYPEIIILPFLLM